MAMAVTLLFPLPSMLLSPLLLLLLLPDAITIAITIALVVHIIIAIPILFAIAFFTPSYCCWLLCVGWMGLDIMDVVITYNVIRKRGKVREKYLSTLTSSSRANNNIIINVCKCMSFFL
jgi:hypothetical protein